MSEELSAVLKTIEEIIKNLTPAEKKEALKTLGNNIDGLEKPTPSDKITPFQKGVLKELGYSGLNLNFKKAFQKINAHFLGEDNLEHQKALQCVKNLIYLGKLKTPDANILANFNTQELNKMISEGLSTPERTHKDVEIFRSFFNLNDFHKVCSFEQAKHLSNLGCMDKMSEKEFLSMPFKQQSLFLSTALDLGVKKGFPKEGLDFQGAAAPMPNNIRIIGNAADKPKTKGFSNFFKKKQVNAVEIPERNNPSSGVTSNIDSDNLEVTKKQIDELKKLENSGVLKHIDNKEALTKAEAKNIILEAKNVQAPQKISEADILIVNLLEEAKLIDKVPQKKLKSLSVEQFKTLKTEAFQKSINSVRKKPTIEK